MGANESVEPVLESPDCQQKLPAWGVIRDFRFGQFIRLYDERVIDGRRRTTPIVLTSDGDIVERPADGNAGTVATEHALPVRGDGGVAALGLHLIDADVDLDQAIGGKPAVSVQVTDLDGLFASKTVTADGRVWDVELGLTAANRLREGGSVLAVGRGRDGNASVLRLKPKVTTVVMSDGDLDSWLSGRAISTGEGLVELDERGVRSLLTTGRLTAAATVEGRPAGLLRVEAPGQSLEGGPAADRLVIDDLAEFLAYPVIPARTGGSVVVSLDAGQVRELRLGNEITAFAGGREISLVHPNRGAELPSGYLMLGKATPRPGPLGPPPFDVTYTLRDLWRELHDYPFGQSGGSSGGGSAGPGTREKNEDGAIHLADEGLPVAVLLPWQQTWTLKGFSRGNLLSTLALAPGEETTITVSSWERRSKALQQSAETEVEQTFDFTSTTRDTEDVFHEVTSSNEFNAQAHGSLDASYSPGIASIHVEAGGQVSNTQSLANVCRTSTQHVRESTTRASTRVRSRRITTITESVETESRTQVVRHLRNPNECHTLTMNFHEVLAHYDVDVRFLKAGVRIVVLVANPVTIRDFDSLTVRVNEATLRAYLLDPALADGFEACRFLEAYARAEQELRRLSVLSKQEKDLDRERTVPPANEPQKQANPQLAPLIAIVGELRRRAALFVGADVGPALTSIAAHRTPLASEVAGAQRWLWRRLVATKFGNGLIAELDRISTQAPSPDLARALLAAVPPAGSVPALDALGTLGDQEKEDAGLSGRIKSMPRYAPADWGLFWYPKAKGAGLYDPDDGGIPGGLAQLRTAFQAWESKEFEGAGVQAAAAVAAQANQEQAATTLADRLEMKFGAEMVGAAMERSEALRAHLNQHRDYYRYVLFQALPPSEQLQRLMDAAPQLRVGMFEPHVVASDGPNLAIPLSPLAETTLMKVITNLANELEKAATDASAAGEKIATDQVILPTPGVSVESWLGECSGCEEHVEALREAASREAVARARIAELEADRRARLLQNNDTSDPDPDTVPHLHVTVGQAGAPES
ncbi:hypothetical protein [Pseudofrankia sp. DC12]|uniref:hypothetical protein n=1 Tax=Pseudofrankia sp. DC12 TaxID=683315 RepID=UPI0005F7F651|nr:hypothetical protein [Pseudofrankia sp. DC12]